MSIIFSWNLIFSDTFPIMLEVGMGISVPSKKDHTAINSFPQSSNNIIIICISSY